jgi:metal-responsive CopG/Arc/MetJ family transcriptional regulator
MSRIDGKRTSASRDRTERLQVVLPGDELAAIDGFRFQARMPSRAAAVRELLRRGLASAKKRLENPSCRCVGRR